MSSRDMKFFNIWMPHFPRTLATIAEMKLLLETLEDVPGVNVEDLRAMMLKLIQSTAEEMEIVCNERSNARLEIFSSALARVFSKAND
jgi:hypothetical protein